MPRKRLTAPFVAKVAPTANVAQTDYFDTVLPAFGLRVGQRRKTYFVMVRVLKDGAWRLSRITIGGADELDLATARREAEAAIARAANGQAPSEVRAERRAAQAEASRHTFATVREEFLAKYRGRQKRKLAPRTLGEVRRTLESDLFAAWQDRPLSSIARRDVLDVLDVLMARGAETMANRTLAYLSLLFGWALEREIVAVDPTDTIKKPGSEKSRERVLSLDELRAIWTGTAPGTVGRGDLFCPICRTLLLTGQRREEVGGMRWSEVDLEAALWTIPASRAKNRREHLVPLAAPVLDILRARQAEQREMRMRTDLVFTSFGPRSFAGWSKAKSRLDARANLGAWTLHDLRRTLATRMAEDLHIPPHVIEATINHVSGTRAGVAGVYNRALYLPERKAALDAWANYVLELVGEVETPTNVVHLHRREA